MEDNAVKERLNTRQNCKGAIKQKSRKTALVRRIRLQQTELPDRPGIGANGTKPSKHLCGHANQRPRMERLFGHE
jgi:hypothetical protein